MEKASVKIKPYRDSFNHLLKDQNFLAPKPIALNRFNFLLFPQANQAPSPGPKAKVSPKPSPKNHSPQALESIPQASQAKKKLVKQT
jgi:hypothetical protein